ncbi:MAG: tetratricopeptide repeat protein [Flavobacteriales bacterium]|nr:tetratricopeptide repeat protein [Flavobacteriales bacterium]
MVEYPLENIKKLIENPEKASEKDLGFFFELTLKYPFSGICYLFLSKILNHQKRIGFEQSLNSTALRIGDRGLLYDRIHTTKKIKEDKRNDFKQEKNNDLNILEKNIYGSLIQNQLINELENQQEVFKNEQEVNSPIKEIMPLNEWLLIKGSQKSNSREKEIDNIIKNLNDRKISTEKKNFYSAADAAKNSLKDNHEMNTETLAEIYVKQGNYPKAIEIYEQLMLSNPEKKLFFASRIKYIKLKTQP